LFQGRRRAFVYLGGIRNYPPYGRTAEPDFVHLDWIGMVYILIISHRLGSCFCFFTFSRFAFERGICPVVKLRVRAGESIQEAVRRFRKLCERSGLRKEMRRKAYYEKPSERRRREELKRLRKARQHQISRV
jgi:small subunit ribosomal protein S21